MATANERQIRILETNIKYIENMFCTLCDSDKTSYILDWIRIHGKTWRKWYNRKLNEIYMVSYRLPGCAFREKEQRLNGFEFNEFLNKVQKRNIINPTWHYNSISIIKENHNDNRN